LRNAGKPKYVEHHGGKPDRFFDCHWFKRR
jgi:hypothetical protein